MEKDQDQARNQQHLNESPQVKESKQGEGKNEENLYPRLDNNDGGPNGNANYYTHNQQNNISNQQPPPSYDELNESGAHDHAGSRFGLIRGYHQQMYEPTPGQHVQCCDCSGSQSKQGIKDTRCNWGIICGILLLILGVLALVMGFTLPQNTPSLEERRRLTPEELKDLERIEYYIEVFVLTGLSVLSLGGVVISAGILYPLCRKGRENYEDSLLNKYYASEVYVQHDEYSPPSKQVVNFGFHKDVVPSDVTLRKIQPETLQGTIR